MIPEEAFKREINKYDILFLCKTCLRRQNINNVSHPNGYLSNFAFRNKMTKKSRSAGAWEGEGSSLLPQQSSMGPFKNDVTKVGGEGYPKLLTKSDIGGGEYMQTVA